MSKVKRNIEKERMKERRKRKKERKTLLKILYDIFFLSEIHISRPSFFGIVSGYPSYIAYPRVKGVDFKVEMALNFTLANNKSALESGLMIFMGQKACKYL